MTPHPPERLRSIVARELSSVGAPGCSLALVTAAGEQWSAGFGLADIRRGEAAAPGTIYHLFSGTKLFTAVAVLQLAERGLLALEDHVTRHVPEAAPARAVTLLQLLSHQSGLKDTLRGLLAVTFPPDAPATTAAALARFRIVPARSPGGRVEYRNVNYALLGEVVSRVSGLEYREYVRRNILAPLGMNVGFTRAEAGGHTTATGYMARRDPMRLVLRFLFPAIPARLYGAVVDGLVELNEYYLQAAAIGGLVGSMPEFAVFLRAQLGSGGGVLSPASVRRMQTLVARGKAGIESAEGVGLGWKFGRVGERRFLNHEGGGAGFTTELRLYPDAGIGIALAMNAMRMPVTMRAAHCICEAVFAARAELEPGAAQPV